MRSRAALALIAAVLLCAGLAPAPSRAAASSEKEIGARADYMLVAAKIARRPGFRPYEATRKYVADGLRAGYARRGALLMCPNSCFVTATNDYYDSFWFLFDNGYDYATADLISRLEACQDLIDCPYGDCTDLEADFCSNN